MVRHGGETGNRQTDNGETKYRWMDRQVDRQTNRETWARDRQANRQIHG